MAAVSLIWVTVSANQTKLKLMDPYILSVLECKEMFLEVWLLVMPISVFQVDK